MHRLLVPFLSSLLFAGCGGGEAPARDDASLPDTVAAAAPPAAPVEADDVVALLEADGRFTRFVATLDTAGLGASLRGPGPFTVFAPTDEAFAALPAAQVAALLEPAARDRLRDVLLYHIVQGTYPPELLRDTVLMAQQGGMLDVRRGGGALTVQGARATRADGAAHNGLAYALDRVLLPEDTP